jgi:hypothetical protein
VGWVSYRTGPDSAEGIAVARAALGDWLAEVQALVNFYKAFDTLAMEQWATVHQVWADRELHAQALTKDAIAADVLAWKPGRRGFDGPAVARVIHEMIRASMIVVD